MYKINHNLFRNMQAFNEWYKEIENNIEIINMQYEIRGTDDIHHVYYKLLNK